MTGEIYASMCCGAVFTPGTGPDNIVEPINSGRYDAIREGDCPCCGADKPLMELVRGFDE